MPARRRVAVLFAALTLGVGACGGGNNGTTPTSGVPRGVDDGGRTGDGGTNPSDNQPSGGTTE